MNFNENEEREKKEFDLKLTPEKYYYFTIFIT